MSVKNGGGGGKGGEAAPLPPSGLPPAARCALRRRTGGEAAPLPPSGLLYVLCGEPLLKAEFLGNTVRRCGRSVYIDLDLLHGGFVRAGLAPPQPSGLLHMSAPDGAGARAALGRAVSSVASARSTVVVDTLNGLYGVAGGNVRRADTALKMLAMAARHTASRIIVACIAERRGDEAWRLLPGGTRLAAAGGGDAAWRRLVRCGGPGRRGTIALEPIAPWDSRRGGAAGGAIDAGAPGLALPRTGQPA